MRILILAALLAVPLLAETVSGLLGVSGVYHRQPRSLQQRPLDNRPIARWFLSGDDCVTATNTGGWKESTGGGGCCTCLVQPSSDTANLLTELLDVLDNALDNMDALSPRPQGMILWDVEGSQFRPADGYVGHPSILPIYEPDMDAVVDDFIAAITSRGYKVGFTIRTNRWRIGASLPPCHSDIPPRFTMFKAMGLSFGNRAWRCNTTTEQWDQVSNGTDSVETEREAVEMLAKEIAYSYNRWGATLFYIDSSRYLPIGGSGTNLFPAAWRQLYRRFQHLGIRLYPENWNSNRINEADTLLYGSDYIDDPDTWAPSYTGPYQNWMITVGNQPSWAAGTADTLAQLIQAGSVLVFDPRHTAQRGFVEEVYALAGF